MLIAVHLPQMLHRMAAAVGAVSVELDGGHGVVAALHRGVGAALGKAAGNIKFCGEPKANFMDQGYAVAKLKMGVIGVTVQIMEPNAKLPADTTVLGRTEAAAVLPQIFEEDYVAPSKTEEVVAEPVEADAANAGVE